ncbi:ELMO/CED-12 family protein [Apiospora kogelbergensis]|uniref:ELMO/CED-12 family protein n=1 Tax=Apiospora kogelbergensis TaxID=1337665 RepID=UPI00312F21EB
MDQADIPALLSRLASDEDAARKMAVFKLQSSINDPSFADVFISSGGLIILRRLIMGTGGNTLAYSLQSLSRLLEVDMGWDIFEGPTAGELVERIVELIVMNPLVNILRGAMSILVALVSHSQAPRSSSRAPGTFGFRALKPAVAVYPQFFDLVIQQLNSADHALCANALMLINSLIRDAVSAEQPNPDSNGKPVSEEWPKFIKRLQDLGLIKAVYNLMQSSALQDLAHPLLEFQSLTKLLLRKWKEVRVDLERPEHRRALKGLHLASAPSRDHYNGTTNGDEAPEASKKGSKRHNPEKWRRLGFETESPAAEFEGAGFLGMMDLTDYVRKNEDGFQKLLLEQSSRPLSERCPVARASLSVTQTLYDQFDCNNWAAGLFRLWKATGAGQGDFEKIVELVRILMDQVVGSSGRSKDVVEVEEDLLEYDLARLRELQMDLLEMSFEENWGQHLYQVRDALRNESLSFVKEQRVRCLLQGSWFSKPAPRKESQGANFQASRAGHSTPWRYAKLSHNRRYLHYADFALRTELDPTLEALTEKIDLSKISSVVSNVSMTNDDEKSNTQTTDTSGPKTSASSIGGASAAKTTTKITMFGFTSAEEALRPTGDGKEQPLLTLYPLNNSLASEWLDGMLMLLDQAPLTADTQKLVTLVGEYSLKIRLLNVGMEAAYGGPPPGAGVVPSRQGLDDDYYYEI